MRIEGLLNLLCGLSALREQSLELGSELGQDQLGCPGAWNRDALLCQGLDDGLDEALVHAWRKRLGGGGKSALAGGGEAGWAAELRQQGQHRRVADVAADGAFQCWVDLGQETADPV